MSADSQRVYKRITAGVLQERVPVSGNKVFVAACSAPFGLACGNRNESIAGVGDIYDYTAPTDPNKLAFTGLNIRNLLHTATEVLTVTLRVGTANVTFNVPPLPNTRPVGWTVQLADGANQVFPGAADEDSARAATYLAAGVAPGSRREKINISSRAAIGGSIHIYSNVTLKLLRVFPMPGVYTFTTDADLKIVNGTGQAIDSEGVPPDVAISEDFYP